MNFDSEKTVKRRRIKWNLLSTRQQKHTPETFGPVIAEIRQRFPSRGAEGIRKVLLFDYKMHVSVLSDFPTIQLLFFLLT